MAVNSKKKVLWALGTVVALLGLYAIAGFVLVPRLLRSAIEENGRRYLVVRPAVGKIAFNPFLLQLEIIDFALPDRLGARLAGFHRLFVDFEVASLWRRAYVFKMIELAAPYADVQVSRSGELNLLLLKTRAPQPSQTGGTEPLPRLEVATLQVSGGSVSYTDASRPNVFTSRLQPIDFVLRDFTTGSDGGRFSFSGVSRFNERLDWKGSLSVQPLASSGEFQVHRLQAVTVWDYFKDGLNFAIGSGSIDIAGRYRFTLRDSADLQLDISRLTVQDLGVRPLSRATPETAGSRTGAEPAWISLPQLVVDETSLNLAQRRIKVAAVNLRGLMVQAWRNADGSFNLATLAGSANANAGSGATEAADPGWQFELGELGITDATIRSEDRSLPAHPLLLLSPLQLSVRGIGSNLTHVLSISLDAGVNQSGKLQLQGAMTPADLSAQFKLQATRLDLTPLQPYIAQQTAMTLHSGRLDVSGDVQTKPSSPTHHVANRLFDFSGNIAVDDLHTTDNELHQDFVNWKRLELRAVKFHSQPAKLSIERVSFRRPYARVIIAADRTLNISRVLAGSVKPAVAAPVRATSRPAAESPQLAVNIRTVLFEQGEANFADLSIQPNFAAGVRALSGTVDGLSSDPRSRAQVKLRGEVNRFSPVAIDGEFNPFSTALYTDLNLSFKNMELTTFNPYSGKFAGYSIAKGKLTTELHYKVQARKLEAQHHVIIDQLEFGPKTESKEAVTLPIKLAVALLKDRHGVIDLSVPVSGTLDDPKFRLGPIIWKIVLNLLVKAVTAPFALLGALFGGGPDLQFIDFSPGIAALDPAAQQRVKGVGKALVERPQLKIEVPIAMVAAVDRAVLAEARFQAEVAGEIHDLKLVKNAPNDSGAATLQSFAPTIQLKILTTLYLRQTSTAAKFDDPPKGTSKDQALRLKLETLQTALHTAISISDAELRALAEQRAEAIQQELLADKQIDPARVFLAVNGKARANGSQARLELTLQ